MDEHEERPEETELVDVSEVSEIFPEQEAKEEKPAAAVREPYLDGRSTIATLRERFAAFFIDCLLLFYAYFLIGTFCRRAFYGQWDGPIPTYGWQGLAFHGIFIFACFMYYFILEGVFFATAGKFCCWMYVRRKNGDLPSMASVFVRNLFRPLDYLLPFIPFFCMELTRRHQRLGDILGGTTVIKKRLPAGRQYHVTMANTASASGRVISSFIDMALVGALMVGYLLLLSPASPVFSRWLLLFFPVPLLLYFVTSEALTHTSPGKFIFGYAITHEDGTPVSLASAIVRTIIRPLDMNPAGMLSIWISSKRQRFGDIAADTIITRQKRQWQGLASLIAWLLISGSLLWAGMQNRESLLHPGFRLNFLPTLEFMGSLADESGYKELTITHIRLAAGSPNTVRTPPVFKAGETIFIISDVYGYEKSNRMVWLQEDIDIRYPDGSIGIHQENIVDYHQVVQTKGAVELTNSIRLPSDAKDGTYTVTITVRDLFGHQNTTARQTFEVRPQVQEP